MWDYRRAEVSYVRKVSKEGERRWYAAVDTSDLYDGGLGIHNPPRMHGRARPWHGSAKIVVEARANRAEWGPEDTPGAILLVSPTRVDTLLQIRAPSYSFEYKGQRQCCARGRAFAGQPQWDVLPGSRLVIADGRTSRLAIVNARGQTVQEVAWNAPKYPVTRDLEDAMVAAIFRSNNPGVRDRVVRARVKEHRRSRDDFEDIFADSTAVITQVVGDDLGYIWVRRFDAERLPEGLGLLWDVFDQSLRHLDVVEIPIGGAVFAISRGQAIGVAGPGERPARTALVAALPKIPNLASK